MNARSSSGRTALGRDSAHQPSPTSTAASGTGQQVYSSPQLARPASASSTQAARPAGASSTQAARPASASSPAASIGSSQLQLLHSQLRSQRKPANITTGDAAVGKMLQESSSAVKAAASYTGQAGTQEVQPKPYQPPAEATGKHQLQAGQNQQQQQPTQQDQHKQQGQQKGPSPLGRPASGLHKAGPVYVNGHHGAARLESAISASYSNITRMLQSLSDEEPTTSSSAGPHNLPASVLPATNAIAAAAAVKPGPALVAAPAVAQKAQPAQLLQPGRPTQEAPNPPPAEQTSPAKGSNAPAVPNREVDLAKPSISAARTAAAAKPAVSRGPPCQGCGKSIPAGSGLTALGSKWHGSCWRCAGCQQPIEGSYNTDKAQNRPYHPHCYKEAFGERCTVCEKLLEGSFTRVEGKAMHNSCFQCTACRKAISDKYNTHDGQAGFFHPQCYKEAFGERCTLCKQTFDGKYTTVKGKAFHYDCFRCTACSKPIDKSYKDDDKHPGFYHPQCYKEAFGERCTVCNKTFDSTHTTVKGKAFHYDCFRCTACSKPIDKSYKDDDKHPGFYHPACHREKFDPRCDVCTQLLPMVDGHIEWSSSYFWKQKYCRKHSSDGTPHCCSCNKLRPNGVKWLTLSDKRMVCQDCSSSVVHDSAQAQPLLDEVLAFFAQQGMALRERPPLLLVDGPTLEAEHGEDYGEDNDDDAHKHKQAGSGDEAPVFHITGLCKSKTWGRVNHVVATQKGYSHLHKQPSLDATLRPADLSVRRVEVTALLVMYGLPRLLTGSILAHECMHAWFVLNYIDCSNKTVNEGFSQLMALIWIEAQKNQVGWQDRLASYYGNQIRTHPSKVYGGGLLAALNAFQQHGLRRVLLHVKKFGVLPAEEVNTNEEQSQKRAIKDVLRPTKA